MRTAMELTWRRIVSAVVVGSVSCIGFVGVAQADNASVKRAIEYQDGHALKLSPQLKSLLKIKHPTAAQFRTTARLSRAFAVKADAAANAVAKTTASTTNGRAGRVAWVQSVRDLANLYRDGGTRDAALAVGNTSAAGRANAKAAKLQRAVDRLDLQAQHDLHLPKGD